MTWLAGGVAVLAVLAAYRWSLARHPWRPCGRCGGSGRHYDTTMWKGTHGRCVCCDGHGRHARWGVRLMQPGRYRDLMDGHRGRYG